jgi:Dynamin family
MKGQNVATADGAPPPVEVPAPASPDGGNPRLLRLAALAEELGSRSLAEEARELSARLAEGRFYVACVGQFKRGKSTLINALLGEPVLPVGFLPVTTVPTVIRYGDRRRARVKLGLDAWREVALAELDQYVSEQHNPENAKGVAGVEVSLPHPLLAAGLCLVDTPGLGSVFEGNTAAARSFIPHIDAALLVVGAEPPLAGEELAMVEAVARQTRLLIPVLNKADRAADEQRAEAGGFALRLLEKRLGRPLGPLLEVSATERLERRGPERDWPKLLDALQRWAGDGGPEILLAARRRGIERLSERLLAILREEREALERPVEESERRLDALKQTLAGAERSIQELSFLFLADERRFSGALHARQRAFIEALEPVARREFDELPASAGRKLGPAYRRRRMRQAQEIARRHVLPWLDGEQQEAEREYRRITERFIGLANDFLRRLAEAGLPEFACLPRALDSEKGFRVRSGFAFLELVEVAQPASPLRWLADFFLGLAGARGVMERAAWEFLLRLLESNSSRVMSDVLGRVQESRAGLEAEVRKLLQEVRRMAEEAVSHARRAQSEGAPAVEAARRRLQRLEAELAALTRAPGESLGNSTSML